MLLKFVAVVAVGGLLAAGCGDDDDDNESSPTTDESSPTTEAGGEEATGEPIVFGFINQEDSPAGSFPETRVAMEAAVEYVNRELGGVDGHPLEMISCKTQGTPESSQTCANQLVEENPLLITGGTDFGSSASIPIFESADLLYVGGIPILPAEYTAPNSYMFIGGSAAAFPGQVVYMVEELGVETVSIIYTDIPAGLDAATTFGQQPLAKMGVTDVNLVPVKPDAIDMTPIVSAAVENDPDAVMVLAAALQCGNTMKAKASLGVSSDIAFFYPGSCSDESVLSTGGDGATDAYFNSEQMLFTEEGDEEVTIYRDKLEQYGSGAAAKLSGYSQAGFQTVMNLYEMFTEIGVDNLSTESLKAFLDGTTEQHNFMANPYGCTGEVVPGLRAVCNAAVRMAQYQDGALVDVGDKWYSGVDLIG